MRNVLYRSSVEANTGARPSDFSGAAEQVYFLNLPVAHIVAWEERMRDRRMRREMGSSSRLRPFMLAS